MTISPNAISVALNGTQAFTATVTNDPGNLGVTWTLSGAGCSGSTCGALSNTTSTATTYTGPSVLPTPATVTLTATSVANTTVSANATITITPPAVSVTPTSVYVAVNATQNFTATVTNDPANLGVTWTVSGTGCSGSTCGAFGNTTSTSTTFTAPATVPTPALVNVTATSVADPSVSASAVVTVELVNTGTLCTGTPTADVPTDVTSKMSMVAPGVTVYQLTGLDKNGNIIKNANGIIWNTIDNSDVINFTSLNPPSFLVDEDGYGVKAISVDHSLEQLVTISGNSMHVSTDGNMIAQYAHHGSVHGQEDVIITPLNVPGACQSTFITNQYFVVSNAPGWSGDIVTAPIPWNGKYLIAYAPGGTGSTLPPQIFSVYSDGSSTGYTPMEPQDQATGTNWPWHKLVIDFNWPIVMSQRSDGFAGTTSIVDLRIPQTIAPDFGDGINGELYFVHDAQLLNGLGWVSQGNLTTGGFTVATIFDSSGQLIPGATFQQSSTNPNGWVIIPDSSGGVADRCSELPMAGSLLCAPEPIQEGGSGTAGIPGLPALCYPVYLMNIATGAKTFIACTDAATTGKYQGFAETRYSYTDASGNYHALFRSDKNGTPQVYEVVFVP